MPSISAEASDMAYEIGIGSNVELASFGIKDGLLRIQASSPMSFFQMSIRASMLADYVFDLETDDEDFDDFLIHVVPDWLQTLTIGHMPTDLEIWADNGNGKYVIFNVFDDAPPNMDATIAAIESFPFATPAQAGVQRFLMMMSQHNRIRFKRIGPSVHRERV
jgi:hypothetical protein